MLIRMRSSSLALAIFALLVASALAPRPVAADTASVATSSEYYSTNQAALAAGANALWWAVAVGGVAVIGLAWLGYRELA